MSVDTMKITVVGTPLEKTAADALVVGVYADDKTLREPVRGLDRAAGGLFKEILDSEAFAGKSGQVTHFHPGGRLPTKRVVVVGLGKRMEATRETLRRAAAAGLRRARDVGARTVALSVL